MRMNSRCRAVVGLALVLLVAWSGQAFADPPSRVARLSYVRGDVSFQPAGESSWLEAQINRPLITGDQLYTDRDSRLELEVGAAALRLDERTTFSLLNLDDNLAQAELASGTLNLRVRRVFEGQVYEIDTPTLAFVVSEPGEYRVDIAPDGSSTMVTVFEGVGDVYGENNASYRVRSGNSYRFYDSALRDYEVLDLPRPDDFDNWTAQRNGRYDNSTSRRYVSEEVIGYQDLDDYGRWDTVASYGSVWFPTRVDIGWTPYRQGHWSWIEPWGWTWIDVNPWGFAPFHYGRWAYIGNRWGWCPGPIHVRPVYAPALVAFIGGNHWGISISSRPVGWFPLGPRDVYVPWYHGSRDYFRRVNVHNTTVINNVNITNIYNNYSNGRPIRADYAYRNNAAAVTAVSRATFVGARPVSSGRVKVDRSALARAEVVSRVGITPTAASIAGPAARSARVAKPPAAAVSRRVIARHEPPAQRAPLASRLETIERNQGRPMRTEELRRSATPAATKQPSRRVQVVGTARTTPKPLPVRTAADRRATPAARTTTPAAGAARPTTPATRTATPANRATPPASRATPRGESRTTPAATPSRSGTRELPSSRYAPRDSARPAARPATPSRSTPSRSAAPARSTERNDDARGAARSAPPSSRYAPRNTRTPATAPSRSTTPSRAVTPSRSTAPARSAAPSRSAAPAREIERSPRATPRNEPRAAPRQSAPVRRETPVRRASPVQQREPVQRTQPAPRPATSPRAPVRTARPPARSAPAQPAPRAQPQQRAQPQPRAQPQRSRAPEREERRSRDDDDRRRH
jgi:hypothetical protein